MLLHHNLMEIPENEAPDEAVCLNLVILADKYHCARIVKPLVSFWLRRDNALLDAAFKRGDWIEEEI